MTSHAVQAAPAGLAAAVSGAATLAAAATAVLPGTAGSGISASASSGGTKIEWVTVNGGTVIRYGNLEVPVGPTRGCVTTRSIVLGGASMPRRSTTTA